MLCCSHGKLCNSPEKMTFFSKRLAFPQEAAFFSSFMSKHLYSLTIVLHSPKELCILLQNIGSLSQTYYVSRTSISVLDGLPRIPFIICPILTCRSRWRCLKTIIKVLISSINDWAEHVNIRIMLFKVNITFKSPQTANHHSQTLEEYYFTRTLAEQQCFCCIISTGNRIPRLIFMIKYL